MEDSEENDKKKCLCQNLLLLVPTLKFSVLEFVHSICVVCSSEEDYYMDCSTDSEMSISEDEEEGSIDEEEED